MAVKLSIAIALLCFGLSIPVLAQEVDTQTFTTEDQSFSFDHPAGWIVEVINADQGPNAHISVDNMPLDQRFESLDAVNLQISLPSQFLPNGSALNETPKEAVIRTIGISEPLSIDFATRQPNQTPQPLELQPGSSEVGEFAVNGRPAAYGYSTSQVVDIESSLLFIVADVEGNYRVIIYASAFKGGLETLKRHEATILTIVQSMRFTPPIPTYSGNPDLPKVYSGLVGVWQRGYITFYYPEAWYVPNGIGGLVFISNAPENVMMQPQAGEFTARVEGVSETRASAESGEVFNQCDTSKSDWTARKLVEKLLSNMTPALLEQMSNAGITMTQPEVTTVNGKEIVYIRQYQNDLEVLAMFIDLGGGNITSMSVTTKQGEMVQFEEQLFAVAGTFQYEPKPCTPEEMGTPTGS